MSRTSVIIPTHNRVHLLPRAIDSARSAGRDIEVIVVDDASTDETPSVCRRLAGIRYRRLHRSVHAAGARNVGAAMASAKYVAFLDDDDILLPGSLDRQQCALDAHPTAAFSYGLYYLGDRNCVPNGDPLPEERPEGDIFWRLLERNFLATHALLIRRACLEVVGPFDRRFPGVEDWDMWIRLAERFPVVSLSEPVAVYNHWTMSEGHLSSNRAAICRVLLRVQARGLSLPRALDAPARTRRRVRRQFCNWAANEVITAVGTQLGRGHYGRAAADLLFALSLSPGRVMRPGTAKSVARCFLSKYSAPARMADA